MAQTSRTEENETPDPSSPALLRRRGSWSAALAAAVIAPWVVWLLLQVLDRDWGYPFVPALAFTPYAALTSVIPVAFVLWQRRWRVAVVAAVVATAFAALLLPRAVPASSAAAAPEDVPLTVLTANLSFGAADPEALVDLVGRAEADVLALQEVTPDIPIALAEAGIAETLPYELVDAQFGAAGSAIYARHELTETTSPAEAETFWFAQPTAEVAVPGAGPVEVTSVHIRPPARPGSASEWRQEIAALPSADDGPVRILAGDFNATLDHAALRELIGTGYVDAADATGAGLQATWPVERRWPGIVIDHVLVDGRGTASEVSVHEIPGSDHRAVLAELALPPPG